jgi:transposase
MRERLNDLEANLEATLRAGKRQSAPFSRGEPKANPERPGRKSGERHGLHGHRQPPEQVDETVAVEAPCVCPDCGGELDEAGIGEQWREEILPTRPYRRRFVIHCGTLPEVRAAGARSPCAPLAQGALGCLVEDVA